MNPFRKTIMILLAGLLLAALGGCAAGGTPTLVPTISIENPAAEPPAPAPAEATAALPAGEDIYPLPTGAPPAGGGETPGYPLPGEQPAQDPGAYPPPPAVPAIENLSRVTARLVEQVPAEENQVRLRAEILSSEPVAGLPDLTSQVIGQQIDLYATAADVPTSLAVGSTFTAEVTYQGDEQGGRYFITFFPE